MQALNKIEIDEYKLGQTNSLPHTDSLSDKKIANFIVFNQHLTLHSSIIVKDHFPRRYIYALDI
jgi:diphthamide biosynthesis methyltransferase